LAPVDRLQQSVGAVFAGDEQRECSFARLAP
jgi:hypothetical protein